MKTTSCVYCVRWEFQSVSVNHVLVLSSHFVVYCRLGGFHPVFQCVRKYQKYAPRLEYNSLSLYILNLLDVFC